MVDVTMLLVQGSSPAVCVMNGPPVGGSLSVPNVHATYVLGPMHDCCAVVACSDLRFAVVMVHVVLGLRGLGLPEP